MSFHALLFLMLDLWQPVLCKCCFNEKEQSMFEPVLSANVTDPDFFSYTLSNLSEPVTAVTIEGIGSGFTYSGPLPSIDGGTATSAEASLTFVLDVPDVGEVEHTIVFHRFVDLHLEDASGSSDPEDYDNGPIDYLYEQAGYLAEVSADDLLSVLTFDLTGDILSGPNPTISYFADTKFRFGTATDDEIFFLGDGGRVDTVGGDDVVIFDGDTGHMRAALRAGDDVFIGKAFGSFYGPEMPGAPTSWVNGGAGDDLLIGGAGEDQLRGFNDADVLLGLAGSDRLLGGGGNDQIFGGLHDDVIFGGSGRDVIDGGLGDDVATGGLGRDLFIFDIEENYDPFSIDEAGEMDVVQDFAVGLDYLHFRSFGTDVSAAQAFAIFQANTVQAGADTVFSYNGGQITLRDTVLANIDEDSFYDKPWLLEDEFSLFELAENYY